MKKLILMAVAMLGFAMSANAQDSRFYKGDVVVNVDYSLGAFTGGDFDSGAEGWGENFMQNGLGATFEIGILDNMINGKGSVGIGGEFGFGWGGKKYSGSDGFDEYEEKIKGRRLHLATRGSFHYSFVPAIDTYAGFKIGIANWCKLKYESEIMGEKIEGDTSMNGNFIFPTFYVGARFMPSDKFGFNLELSYDKFAFAAMGISLKF